MRTYSIYTLGCKVNQYESQQMRELLESAGLRPAGPNEKADLAVINTCCVTATASAKSRQYVQRAAKLNPQCVRVVCGCLPAMKGSELKRGERGNNLHIVASRAELPSELMRIARDIQNIDIRAENRAQSKDACSNFANFPRLPLLTKFSGHTRAFLKVQDGCDGACSYCVIPKVRPDVHSKPVEEAVTEAKALVAAGHKEIVVTGICLGAYGRETVKKTHQIFNFQCSICDLLTELAKVQGLVRIRVSSLEPGDINDQLLDVFCAHSNIMPHIHLSVQSGAGRILKRMCRQYDAEELREKIALIKSRLDRPAITADMIVGFPGETQEDFQQTIELARWAEFSKMHVFQFSARAGTAAARMKNRVQPKVVKQRADVLRKLGDELGRKFREQFVGETCEVLIEGSKDGQAFGRCERYFMVYLDPLLLNQGENHSGAGGGIRKNEIVNIKITAVTEEGAEGEIKR